MKMRFAPPEKPPTPLRVAVTEFLFTPLMLMMAIIATFTGVGVSVVLTWNRSERDS